MDEFGDRGVTETHDSGISSDESSSRSVTLPIHSVCVLIPMNFLGRESLGKLENTPPVQFQNSCKLLLFLLFG